MSMRHYIGSGGPAEVQSQNEPCPKKMKVHGYNRQTNTVFANRLLKTFSSNANEEQAEQLAFLVAEGGESEACSEWVLGSEVLYTEEEDARRHQDDEAPVALLTSAEDLKRAGAYIPSLNRWERVWCVGSSGVHLRVLEDVPQEGGQMTLWPGALLMAELLGKQDLKGKGTVVELGAGCGLLSMVAYARGARRVVATEQLSSLPYLTDNLRLNRLLAGPIHPPSHGPPEQQRKNLAGARSRHARSWSNWVPQKVEEREAPRGVHPHELQWGDDTHIDRLLEGYAYTSARGTQEGRWGHNRIQQGDSTRAGGGAGRNGGRGQHGGRAMSTIIEGPGSEAFGGHRALLHRRQVASEGGHPGRASSDGHFPLLTTPCPLPPLGAPAASEDPTSSMNSMNSTNSTNSMHSMDSIDPPTEPSQEREGVGLVLGCEITYDASLYGPLAYTLHRLLTSSSSRPPLLEEEGEEGGEEAPFKSKSNFNFKRPFHPFDSKGPRALLLHNPESTPSCKHLPLLLDRLRGEYGMIVTVTEMADLLGEGDGRRWISEGHAPMLLIDVRPGR